MISTAQLAPESDRDQKLHTSLSTAVDKLDRSMKTIKYNDHGATGQQRRLYAIPRQKIVQPCDKKRTHRTKQRQREQLKMHVRCSEAIVIILFNFYCNKKTVRKKIFFNHVKIGSALRRYVINRLAKK